MNAYDKNYLENAMTSLGCMLDFAVHDLGYMLGEFWDKFIQSGYSRRFGSGEAGVLAGMSGYELAYEVIGNSTDRISPRYTMNRSPEFWTGWAIAYYQWQTGMKFSRITEVVTIDEICSMYSPYHEMDIRQFCDAMNALYIERAGETNLKRIRKTAQLSQSELAAASNIPIRTIQQYEQRQKNINKAQAEYIIELSRVLCCEPVDLLEHI